jgi:transposase InsO family protein
VYPAPNACWQLDATEYVLTGGRTCVIFQLIDDHSRYALASHIAWAETADAAIAVVDKAINAHGVPQRLLSDNGVALNPSRRGHQGQLVTHLTRLGVQAITGKPYKPTTQGKNERFHQTLFRWLDKQPLAPSLTQLQTQVEQFDHIYNTQRPHQGLPGRVTPQTAWLTTPKAEPPRPTPDRPKPPHQPAYQPAARPTSLPEDTRVMQLRKNGTIRLHKVTYMVDGHRAGQDVIVVQDDTTITIADLEGTILIQHTPAAPGLTYIGNGRPRGRRPQTTTPSPMS